ncbi:MAG TPA: hypothetical protein VES88_08780 [Gemmatimonadaceae bacterium]|nr:hypothetical protein [Gemmatimonadaceae bacterium]
MRKAEGSVGVLLTLTVIWLHYLVATSAGPLWRDEAGGVGLATLPTLEDVWANLRHDSFPILWPLALREYSALVGPMNDPALRALGFWVGAGIVAALWFSAVAFRNSVPLLSLALLAMNPSLIVWGDSIRAYGFGALLILLAGALLWRFVEEPGVGRFSAAAVAAIVSVHALYNNSVLVLAFCAGGVAVCALEQAWKKAALVVLIGALAAISLVPYAAMIQETSSVRVLQTTDYNLGWFRERLNETLRPAGAWAPYVWVGAFAVAVMLGVRAVRLPGQLAISQSQRRLVLFALVSLVVGVVGTFVFLDQLSWFTRPWYYITLLALAAVCIDALFGAVIHTVPLRIARLGIVLLLAAATILPAAGESRQRMTNVDLIASRLHQIGRPGDLILVNGWYPGVSFSRYYRGPVSWMTVPPLGFYRYHRYDKIKTLMMLRDQTMPVRPATDQAAVVLQGGHRVFIVGGLIFSRPNRPRSPPRPAPRPGDHPWPEAEYSTEWSLMLGDFLREHSSTLVKVPVEVPTPVSPYEDLELLVAEGWRP